MRSVRYGVALVVGLGIYDVSWAHYPVKHAELTKVPLENYDQMQFFGRVQVGKPPQVIFDTGSRY